MYKPSPNFVQQSFKLSEKQLQQVETFRRLMARSNPGWKVTKSDSVRALLEAGFAAATELRLSPTEQVQP